jgi:hypothetical protein
LGKYYRVREREREREIERERENNHGERAARGDRGFLAHKEGHLLRVIYHQVNN